RRRHTRFSRDWSSDVCSSDLRHRCGTSRRSIGSGEEVYLSASAFTSSYRDYFREYFSSRRFGIFHVYATGVVSLPCHFYFHVSRSEEHTSELQSRENLVCRLL